MAALARSVAAPGAAVASRGEARPCLRARERASARADGRGADARTHAGADALGSVHVEARGDRRAALLAGVGAVVGAGAGVGGDAWASVSRKWSAPQYAPGGFNSLSFEVVGARAAGGLSVDFPSGWQRYEALPPGRYGGEGVQESFQNPRELGETLTVFAAYADAARGGADRPRAVGDVYESAEALGAALAEAAPQQELVRAREVRAPGGARAFEVLFSASAITAGPYGKTYEWRKYLVDSAGRLVWVRATATSKRYYAVRGALQHCVDSFGAR